MVKKRPDWSHVHRLQTLLDCSSVTDYDDCQGARIDILLRDPIYIGLSYRLNVLHVVVVVVEGQTVESNRHQCGRDLLRRLEITRKLKLQVSLCPRKFVDGNRLTDPVQLLHELEQR